MTGNRIPEPGALPAEFTLLLFHADGVALGVEAAAVEGILDAEDADRSGTACRYLADWLEADGPSAAGQRPRKRLLLKSRTGRCGVGIDSLDEIVTVPTTALQALPEPLSFSRGPRRFWGGIVRADRVVLLVDVDRLLDPRVRADPAAEKAFQPLKKQDSVQEARRGRGQAALEAGIAIRHEQRLG